jgi:hypothetical protein
MGEQLVPVGLDERPERRQDYGIHRGWNAAADGNVRSRWRAG